MIISYYNVLNFLLSVLVKDCGVSFLTSLLPRALERRSSNIQGKTPKNNEDGLALVVLALHSSFTCCCLGNQSQITFSAIRFFGNGRRHMAPCRRRSSLL